MAFSDFLRSLRVRHNLTREEFCRKTGISRPYLSVLEGKAGAKSAARSANPSAKVLEAIGREFRLDIGGRLEMIDSIIGEDFNQSVGKYREDDVYPLLLAIVVSGLNRLTPAEFELLVKIQTTLGVIVSPHAVRMLIEEKRSIQQPT